jgi:hypothetical protein
MEFHQKEIFKILKWTEGAFFHPYNDLARFGNKKTWKIF